MDWRKLLKALIFLAYVIVIMTGVGLISLGAWSNVEKDPCKVICEEVTNTTKELNLLLKGGYLPIALGVVLTVIGLRGCLKTLCKLLAKKCFSSLSCCQSS